MSQKPRKFQLPVPDDLAIYQIDEKIQGEKVLCRDLAKYLGCGVARVKAFAKERAVLHSFWIRPTAYSNKRIYYVTPFIAARIIVWVRAMQEEKREKARRPRSA